MTRFGWIAGLAVTVATTAPMAETYTLTIQGPIEVLRSVRVKGATPDTYKIPRSRGKTVSIEVTMPAGLCETRVTLFLTPNFASNPRAEILYDVCSEGGLGFR